MFTIAMAEAVTKAKSLDQIDKTSKVIWSAYGQGMIGEAEAQKWAVELDERKKAIRLRLTQKVRPSGSINRPVTHERLRRRRTWSASSQIPASIACHYTPGQQAALAVIVSMLRSSPVIAKTLQEIGDIAGVCRKTVQRTLQVAKLMGHLQVQERRVSVTKSLPHRIQALDPALRQWIAKKPIRWTNQSNLKRSYIQIDTNNIAKTKPNLFCSSGESPSSLTSNANISAHFGHSKAF